MEERLESSAGGRMVATPIDENSFLAWTQVAASFLMAFNSLGYVSSFGLFQSHWQTTLGRSALDIAWVGSLSLFLIYFLGNLSGKLMDNGFFRSLLVVGTICQVAGIFTTSAVSEYWQLLLASGLLQGLGNGLLFTPAVTLIATYFVKQRAVAMALTACGAPVGGIVFPLIVIKLSSRLGYPWTIRVMGFVVVGTSILIVILARPKAVARKSALLSLRPLCEPAFAAFAAAIFFILWGLYIAYFYVSTFGRGTIGLSEAEALQLLIILNAGGIPGRLLPAYLADRHFGPFGPLIISVVGTAIMLYGWIGIRSKASFYAFAVLYGVFANAVQTLLPTAVASLTRDMAEAGGRIGLIFTIGSLGCLTGPPIAGVLIDMQDGSYMYAQVFAATVMVIGFAMMYLSKLLRLQRLR